MVRLKQLRNEHKISQQKLASIVNVSQQSIYKYEHNLSEPDLETLKAIANYFDCSVDYLIGNTDVVRKYEVISEYYLSEQELNMIIEYRKLPKDLQNNLLMYALMYNNK